MRAWGHYFFAASALGIYGGSVCPFIGSLSTSAWLAEVVTGLAVAKALRLLLLPRLVETAPAHSRVRRQFWLEFGLLLALGLGVTFFNMAVLNFPLVSGLKVVLACATLGYFAGVDLALERERDLALEFQRTRQEIFLDQVRFPLSRKVGLAAGVSILAMAGVLFLVVLHDLDWLTSLAPSPGPGQPGWRTAAPVLLDVAFVAGVFLLHCFNLIASFSRNLSLFLGRENQALARAGQGLFDRTVPVATKDELGLLASHTNQTIDNLRSRTEELSLTQEVTILTLASLAETRDNETGGHIQRTQRYVQALAERLAQDPRHAQALPPEVVKLLYQSAPLHDIGKVGVPDAILLKPGRLTPEEFQTMKLHTVYGRDSLQAAEERLGQSSFLRLAREIAYTHHEMWDGKGYPQGLKGEGIPLSGRLMALADVYDALISKRVYKEAFSHQRAREIILAGQGSHFDPQVVAAFLELEERFQQIARDFADSPAHHDALTPPASSS